jgi:hypothetical protein
MTEQVDQKCGLLQTNGLVQNYTDATQQTQSDPIVFHHSHHADCPTHSRQDIDDEWKEIVARAANPIIQKTLSWLSPDYPFGCVHMSLMFGPLIIENGVAG